MNKKNIHIVKREPMVWYKSLLVRAAAVIASLLLSAVVITVLTKKRTADGVVIYPIVKIFFQHFECRCYQFSVCFI